MTNTEIAELKTTLNAELVKWQKVVVDLTKLTQEHTEKVEALESLLREVVDTLVYQPEIPQEHKQAVVGAFIRYRKSINMPLKDDQSK